LRIDSPHLTAFATADIAAGYDGIVRLRPIELFKDKVANFEPHRLNSRFGLVKDGHRTRETVRNVLSDLQQGFVMIQR